MLLVHGAVQQKNSYIGTEMVKHSRANRDRTASEGPSGNGTTINYRQGFLARSQESFSKLYEAHEIGQKSGDGNGHGLGDFGNEAAS